MRKTFYFLFTALLLSACNGPLDLPSDGELEDLIAENIEETMSPLSFLNIFSNKREGKKKMFEFKRLENLKRADWEDDKQKFKADVTLDFGLNLPSIDLEGLFNNEDDEIKFEKKKEGNEMTVEVQGYLFKDEFDEWVVEFVD
jgi:hypothetical protein